jgi:hypothetical protein
MAENELTLEDVKSFIDANKEKPEVTEYIMAISIDKPLTSEVVMGYLNTIEGKGLIQPLMDQRVTDAIKTHDIKMKAANEAAIKAGVNAELARLNPTETAEQKMIRELNKKQEEMQTQWEREKLESAITMEAAKRGVPLELVKDVPYPSLDHFINIATVWEQVKSKEVDKLVNERIASVPPPGSGKPPESKFDISKLNKDEILKLEMSGELDKLLKGD